MVVTNEKCYICGARTDFNIVSEATLLREAQCAVCSASLRNSDVAKYIVKALLNLDLSLKECIDDLTKFKILEAASSGPIHDMIKDLPFYTCFEYYDGIKPGEYINGVLCNDLQNLTFNSECFDLIITQDVMEHVKNPEKAIKEIQRVLKNGGVHIFSVPLHDYKKTTSRKDLKPVFHGDPLRDGIQVETDWGLDICEIIDRYGMKTVQYNQHTFYESDELTNVDIEYDKYMNSEHINFFKYNSVVFVSQKKQEGDMVKFTGERYIPGKSDSLEMDIEHLQRYYTLGDIVKGKVIVDAACGEGYGSMYLANRASKVIGIDISEETINTAKKIYKRDNLDYLCASIDNIPIEDKSVDIIISYETIEHVDSKTQHGFMSEIKRILKDDGLLIISTPNKEVYSDLFNYKNPHHVKEFNTSDFRFFLKSYFEHVKMYYQRFEVASLINSGEESYIKVVNRDVTPIHNSKYLIAVCSNFDISISMSSIVYEKDRKYIKLIQRIIETQNEIEKLGAWGKQLDEEIRKRDELIGSQNTRIEELSVWGKMLDEEVINKNDILASQNAKIEELSLKAEALENENTTLNKLIKSIETTSEHILDDQEERMQSLLEKEKELDNIYRSRGWRYLLKAYKLEDKIIPLHSKQREVLKAPYFMLKNLKLIVKHTNRENLKKFYSYAKKESPTQVLQHIKSYLNRYKPIAKMELQIYDATDKYEKLSFVYSSHPLVSIIIPVYNQWKYTYSCLCSILQNTAGIEYEIIIADDGSTDETSHIEDYAENVIAIRNTKNLGFLLNCNHAAKQARGKYIMFLNNDTNVQKDWLRYLVELIEKDSKIGMVGSKLVYADGRLQEAGGIIWKDASGWNYGRLDDPEKPEYNYVKEVDYISGASIMIRADLWYKIGGFDERFAPAYCEDSDLAFEVRKHGYKVMFQPKSVVVHFEGISHGTDTGTGIKSYQVKNRERFLDKWEETLKTGQFDNGQNVFLARDRSRNKKSILVIDHYVPHYDKDAGSRTTFQYLKLFTEIGLNVKFIGDNFYRHEPYTSALQQLGVEVLYGVWYSDNWKKWIKENAEEIDYVYLNRPHISIKYIDYIRNNTKAKVIYYGHDLHYLRELREYDISRDSEILKSAENWKKIEFKIIGKADAVYYPSQIEIDEIRKHIPKVNAKAIPAYIFDITESTNEYIPEDRKDIMFVGGFTHKPNIDAVLWFAKKIYPLVLNEIPNMKFYIIGSNPTDEVRKLASDSIIVTGFVSDEQLDKYYESCKLTVVPLRYGAGVKGKIVEAMFKQMPVITTPIGAEGLINIDKALVTAESNDEFANYIIRYYNNDNLLEELTKSAFNYVKKYFTKQSVIDSLKNDIVINNKMR